MKKRIISIAVSLCMVLSLFPISAYAEEMCTEHITTPSQGKQTENAVEKVQAMLNALPTAEELEGANEATVNAAYEAAQDVYDAIEELGPEEVSQLTNMDKLTALMDWFNGQVMALLNIKDVDSEEELRNLVQYNSVTINLTDNITLTSPLEINYSNPQSNFSTKIITNGYSLTGTIKLNGCTLTVDGTLDADIEANSIPYSPERGWNSFAYLNGGTYKGTINLNDSATDINSGTYEGKITGTGMIKDGIFKNTVECKCINNGTFNCDVTCERIYDGIFKNNCTVPEGANNCIDKGLFYGTLNYTYKRTLVDGETSYYIIYKDGNSTYATEYMYDSSGLQRTSHGDLLTNPSKTDYTFKGWYQNSNLEGTPFNLNSLSTNDFTDNLYAKWEHKANAHVDENPKDHKCDICNATLSTCSGGKAATCSQKSVCDYCGKEYGSLNENNHTLEHHKKNAATEESTGNKEYWQCTGCGKIFLDEDGKKNAEQKDITIKKLPVIINGKGQSLKAGEAKELSFRSDAEFSDFIRVELDGNIVDEKNYTKREGSTIITLKAEYVSALPKGEHTISIVSTSGTASTVFALLEESTANTTVTEKISPATKDDNHIGLWIAILLFGGFLMTASIYGKKSDSELC